MRDREDDPAILRGLLDRGPYIAALVAGDGTVRWVSEDGSRRVFGYEPTEVIGTNILDYLDPTWDPAAFDSIGQALVAEGLRLPTTFRAVRKDGTPQLVEVWANAQLHDPVLDGLVVYVRRWDERILLDQALEALGRGEPVSATESLLLASMACETLEADGAIIHGPADGAFTRGSATEGLAPALRGLDGARPDTPWGQVLATGARAVAWVDDLPADVAGEARAAGFDLCWAWPVDDLRTGGVTGCVICWRRGDQLEPDHSRVEALDRVARIEALALERAETMASLHRAATIDPLTGLANRARFYAVLDEVAEAASADGLAVLYIDLDGFKPVNDEFGHTAGDVVLVALAERLTGGVRGDDLVARLGGDEFAVICPGVSSLDELEDLVARLVDVVVAPIDVGPTSVTVGVSVGGALGTGVEAADELVEVADAAMYEVKSSGKGGWRLVVVPSAR